jgi:class 3 adenylate cyclase
VTTSGGILLERRHAIVRGLLARFHGREVDTAGDGLLAQFDGPHCTRRRDIDNPI